MRWFVFAIVAYVLLALQVGFASLLTVQGMQPSLLLPLAVFIALHANGRTAAWACMLIGLLADLETSIGSLGAFGDVTLIGPLLLGYFAGFWVVAVLRGMVVRETLLGHVTLVVIAGTFVHLVSVAILVIRTIPWLLNERPEAWSASDVLFTRFLSLAYTAFLTFPIGYFLARLKPIFGFEPTKNPAARYGIRR